MTNSSRAGAPRSPLAVLDQAIANLHPAYFALVMATGIVSIAGWGQGFHTLARVMLVLNTVFFLTLWAFTLLRLVRHPGQFWADLNDHTRGPGFFTTIAGTCVFGSQTLVILQIEPLAWTLWIIGVVLWVLISYTVFAALTVKATKPPLGEGLNGGWLVAIVATQSVSLLASRLALHMQTGHEIILFIALVTWLGGSMLYVWIISLIFYRYTFFSFKPSDLAPPYWINMGAMAISTLAGATLIAASSKNLLIHELLPFEKGATLLFWATATWWIPMLLILGFWRHRIKHFPLRYDPLYWGAVFPLGMYSAATARMSEVIGLPFLNQIPPVFFYVAFAAWTLTFIGLIHRLFTSISAPSPQVPAPARP